MADGNLRTRDQQLRISALNRMSQRHGHGEAKPRGGFPVMGLCRIQIPLIFVGFAGKKTTGCIMWVL